MDPKKLKVSFDRLDRFIDTVIRDGLRASAEVQTARKELEKASKDGILKRLAKAALSGRGK